MSKVRTKHPEIRRDTRTGMMYYQGTPVPGGGQITRSLECKTEWQALRKKRELLIELRGLDPNDRNPKVSEVAEVLLKEKERHQRGGTHEFYYFSYQNLKEYFEDYRVTQITDEVWDDFVDGFLKEKAGHGLIGERRFMMAVLRKARVAVLPKLRVPKRDKIPRRVFMPDEIRRIYEAANDDFKGIVLLMYKMGLRPAEAYELSWDRVWFDRNRIHLRESDVKDGARTIRINPTCREWLLKRKVEQDERAGRQMPGRKKGKTYSKTAYVFPSRVHVIPRRKAKSRHNLAKKGPTGPDRPLGDINSVWNRLVRSLEIPVPNVPYCLRHTFLTECAKRIMENRAGKGAIAKVCRYAGTSIEEFERTYLHLTGEDTAEIADLMEGEGAAI